jgi:ribonuclease/clavin/mitogillin
MSEGGGNLYEGVLQKLAGAAPSGGALPPRASAAVVPWRRAAAGGIEVYWVKRGEALPFMGGWHAFPGGGLSRADAAIPVIPPASIAAVVTAATPDATTAAAESENLVPGILVCAVRELFEETGILLGRPAPAAGGPEEAGAAGETGAARAMPDAPRLAEARRQLLGGRAFAAVLEDLDCVPDAGRLVYAGRWLTPPFAPLRFDNRFFLLEWPPGEAAQPEVIPGELESGAWIDAAAAWETWRRGDVLAAPPILHLLLVLAEAGPRHGLPRLLNPAEADLGPVRRVELRPGVLMFPLATRTLPPALTTNAYLLGTGDAVLVDPGSPDPAENSRLVEALAAARQLLGRRVTAIWLTHHHSDHVAGVAELRQRLGVPVLAHAATAERLAAQGIAVDAELTDGQEVSLASGSGPQGPGRTGVAPSTTGSSPSPMVVQVIHTPGHARGHLCFLELGQRSLLAGDMAAGLGTIVVDPPEGDMDDYLASLAKLIAIAPRTLFPGHGPAVKNAVPKLQEYIDHRLWREQRILAAWRAGHREPQAMLATVYDDVPREAHALAARQILAHLTRLRRAGQLDEAEP